MMTADYKPGDVVDGYRLAADGSHWDPVPPTTPTEGWGRTVLPTRASGWVALAAAAVGLGSWVVLPIVTAVFGDTYAVTDSYVMPLIGVALVAIAAVVNVLVLWLGRQRCVLCIVATVLTVGAAGLFGFITIGGWLGGA